MKHISIRQGQSELNSTSGNLLVGKILRPHITSGLPQNFSKRCKDAICDRDLLLTQIGLFCNARNEFNDIDLYRHDDLFLQSFGIKGLASEAIFR